MENKDIKISVALCTYNGEKYIEEQLKSILEQSVPVSEIVVFDDCSSDTTILILKRFTEALFILSACDVSRPTQ